ncbi:hypothetical protein HIM_01402 [Hirsutella minnesotensis 3608]|nr:hypothetical protein HIM_01402 [Hirsutella minnesotensis 3608]
MDHLTPITEFQNHPADFIPILKYLPRGFPGVAYKEKAERSKRAIEEIKNTTPSFVLNRMRVGVFRPSFVSALVQQHNKHEGGSQEYRLSSEDEYIINAMAPSLVGGATDTLTFVLQCFILAMVKSPEVQRKAQEEIDQIIGNNGFPSFKDRARLPYVNSVVKECLRWYPSTATGTPHTMQQDTTCNGYYVPKGAIVMANIWWLLQDPDIYQDPEEFKPERFLKPLSEPDPETVIFGYGRRACPGKFFADSVLFACIAHTLSAFNITKAVDEQGAGLDVKMELVPGLVHRMMDFPYKITPRDAKKAELLRRFEADQPQEESDAVHLEGLLPGGFPKDCS